MADRLHIKGEWPAPLIISRGWWRCSGRPWNDDHRDAAIRLERGGSGFLREASEHLKEVAGASVFSPALVEPATRVWLKAGYAEHADLEVMERSLALPLGEAPGATTALGDVTDVNLLTDIDNRAFEGFWRIGSEGLREALAATSLSTVIVTEDGAGATGFAVVGVQAGTSFLQRIAVLPDLQGTGLGFALLAAALTWARRHGAVTMMLNVRPGASRARRLYLRNGFTLARSSLHVLKFDV